MAPTISMGQYLFKRIAELGNEHVFGVPGDFNRRFAGLISIELMHKKSGKTKTDFLQWHFLMNFSRCQNSNGWEHVMNSMPHMQRTDMHASKACQLPLSRHMLWENYRQ
jgi:hypothetical protein